ncbi:MAG: RNA polymerase sigma-70 factor [Bacteroidales bacterium]|nr:RNA polymerase sigma-70 factor [Bacteroidales bacterium]
MSLDIEKYWEKIKTGDENAFKRLFNVSYALLRYYSIQFTHDVILSEDIVMMVFEKIWNKRKTIIINSSFKSYLFQTIRNDSFNEIRKLNTAKNAVNKTATDAFWKIVGENAKSQDYIIEKLMAQDTTELINKAVASLPAQCRQVFLLSREEGKTTNEIASLLNISPITVRAHIFTSLKRIRKILAQDL